MTNKEIEILVNEKDLGFLATLIAEKPYGLKIVKEDLKSNVEIYYQKKKIGELFDVTKLKNHLKTIKIREKYFKYLLPEEKSLYYGIDIFDIYDILYLLAQENKIVYFLENKVYFPFCLKDFLKNHEIRAKYFYFSLLKFPYEFVSKINKGSFRQLVINSLVNILKQNNLSYYYLPYYPENYSSVFLFRIDGDFATQKTVEKVFDFLIKEELKFTFFVDVKSSVNFLKFFGEKQNEKIDIQLHCYLHYLDKEKEKILRNLFKGKKLLEDIGIKIFGFAAPFGLWNCSLNEVLEELEFSYSSEFGFDYDDLPILPIITDRFSKVWQIPIHPISISRLKTLKFSIKEMVAYYQEYILRTYHKGYPIIIYAHPQEILAFPEVFKEIFSFVKNFSQIKIMTFTEFFEWWQKRGQTENYQEKKFNLFKLPSNIKYIRKNEFYLKIKSFIWNFNRIRKTK
uniref:NodB homology domain-containing protein n=1 Tax=candidate division WOR-3 bacterium TaxID=2052148 RepID=A0A7V3ZW02_UNCW3